MAKKKRKPVKPATVAPTPPPQDTSPEALYQHSMALINDAIKSCNLEGMEGFEPPPLMVAEPVTKSVFGAAPLPQSDFFALAKQLFEQQEGLYSDSEAELAAQAQQVVDQPPAQNAPYTAPPPDPAAQSTDQSANSAQPEPMDDSLAAIHDMFKSE